MLYQKIRTKFYINCENLSNITIEGSKTPQNEKARPTVHKTAPKIGLPMSKRIENASRAPTFRALSDETR